jgi:hydrogenase-4 transcriptional activator
VPSTSLGALLARAASVLERGQGAEASQMLAPVVRSPSFTRDEDLAVRSMLAEACLLQDDLDQAAAILGRTPDTLRETVSFGRLSALWRLHGRLASARGDQSRAIALHGRALKQAELAHDARAIGLANYELGHCYRQVGEAVIVREHITKAASALHAAGDRRHLALVHSLSGISLAQLGRSEEALTALRHAEHLASQVSADDVVATVCGNQANVMMLQHRYEQALALAERSVSLHEAHGSGHGLAVALGTLGQICVRVGDLTRAAAALHRALDVRAPIQFHETTGAVFDTLAQIELIRGGYDSASDYLVRASEAYGAFGRQTSRWYEWSVRLLSARLELKRGRLDQAVAISDEILVAGAPPFESLQATLIAAEALTAADRLSAADRRLSMAADNLDPKNAPAAWGEYLRLRGALDAKHGSAADAYHAFAQSATLLDLLGERYQAGLSHLSAGRLVAHTGARSIAEHHLSKALAIFQQLGAERDRAETEAAEQFLAGPGPGGLVISAESADDAIVRRIVDAAALPELLGRETAAALFEASMADASVVFVRLANDDVRIVGAGGCTVEVARRLARSGPQSGASGPGVPMIEPLGRDGDGPRFALVASPLPIGHPVLRRLRMITAVARQGFALCAARDRSAEPASMTIDQSLEPLLPGFLCASTAMSRVVERIQRLQGNDLTVLITGESGTGKELVARAVHIGSHRSGAMFLPYNCTTTGRELADSQLFGHRRGSFTGAVSDQRGVVRSAAGGTLFLDEIGDLALEIQPKLLRFLEQQEIMPIGETLPQRVDVRVLAATNADLEQRVAEGKFREDLYYRLNVIRIHVPPLRERKEEIPHLSTYFLREALEKLGKPDVHLSADARDVFSQYWWPGNVRQLKNEIQRAVALSAPGETIDPIHLSPEVCANQLPGIDAFTPSAPSRLSTPSTAIPATAASSSTAVIPSDPPMPVTASTPRTPARDATSLASAVEHVERDLIQAALDRSRGNISESARTLGLTRRGLYLKIRRLGLAARA